MKLQKILLALVMLLASACNEQPTEVGEIENEGPVYITFKGRVEFSDGTVFESSDEKRVRLPKHLWGHYVREENARLGKTNAYADFYYEFVLPGTTVTLDPDSYVIYEKTNLGVCGCMTDWQTRSIVTVVPSNSADRTVHYSNALDPSIPGGVLYSGNGSILEPQTGICYSGFWNTYAGDFSNDDDVDTVLIKVTNYDQETGTITFSSIKFDLRSNDSACTPC